jgi:AcrR family transcriptional regulator
MRTRDEQKQEAIREATIKLVNEIGFVAGSVSKIAREAGVSPATIYIYYENKQDLLLSTYMDIKKRIGLALLKNFDDTQPIRDILKKLWQNMFDYSVTRPEYFQFSEQFANSPYASLVNHEEIEQYFGPVFKTMDRGIKQKILKDVPLEVMGAFIYSPIMILSNTRVQHNLEITEEIIEIAFSMAWDAIRL